MISSLKLLNFSELYALMARYKEAMVRAVEAKSLALRKLRLYEEVQRDAAGGDPEAVLARPAADLASVSVEWELRTGIVGFPWRELEEGRVQVDMGDWTPQGVEPMRLATVKMALTRNQNLRSVLVRGKELGLPEGWTTREIAWDNRVAVQEAPEVAALLIQLCTGLEKLSLWYVDCQTQPFSLLIKPNFGPCP